MFEVYFLQNTENPLEGGLLFMVYAYSLGRLSNTSRTQNDLTIN